MCTIPIHYVPLVFAAVGIQETKECSPYHYSNEHNKYGIWKKNVGSRNT